MKIISWNVAGIRAMLKKGILDKLIADNNFDIICLQETKAEEEEVKLSQEIMDKYPYRFWHSTQGTTQRKGLSGTAIFCKESPLYRIDAPKIDQEGRITAIEFDNYIIVCVYTPNSQKLNSPRYVFRTEEWHVNFLKYIAELKDRKPTIICGDLNVAHNEIDIHHPEKHRNIAGFLDLERSQFQEYLAAGYVDAFRYLYPDVKEKYTYWNRINPKIRQNNSGWRIDYYLVSQPKLINEVTIWDAVSGSDHCPIYLELNNIS
jgi:exodeoxyribonuclease III